MTVERFRAMGCDVEVGGAGAVEVAAVRALFEWRDRTFSRFRANSELVRVNAARGPVVVSELFARTVREALAAAAATDGLVDPTLGRAVVGAGYDRDYAELEPSGEPPGEPAPGRWSAVRLAGRSLSLPDGVELDLNGIVKGLAVDDAAALVGSGFVAAGGDVATRGETVVGLPGGSQVRLARGGIATSGSARRRWLRAGRWQHHLIDPRTGLPAESPWSLVTVAAGTCAAADVAAKAAFLLGADGPDWLDAHGLPGRFLVAGRVYVNAAWRERVYARTAA